jgi:hypothetical protein
MAEKPMLESGTTEAVAFKLWEVLRGSPEDVQVKQLTFFRECLDSARGISPKS